MKYIMFEVGSSALTRKVPVVFPNILVHRLAAEAMASVMKAHWPNYNVKVVSAGEYSPISGEVSGRSESLGIGSQRGDGNVITSYDYLHGV